MPALPPVVIWTLGVIGGAVLVKLCLRQWQRANADLDRARKVTVQPERAPTLRRDPRTGVYRP